MKYKVFTIMPFDRQLKRLAKKYPSLKEEYANLLNSLETNPEQGTFIGNHCFKIRMAIASKAKGKSGGARVIAHILVENETVYLLSIYDKSDQENITNKEIIDLLKHI
ncbi:MAG: type II toxin-antitoxin system RelE/ParE family toxin [Bacteroidia bacterium]|nr:type II toxin-antitoxin system RelE/ParE family toxin [Bacteroidia bacterium]